MNGKQILAIGAILFASPVLGASVYWIPAAAHAAGVGGSLWRTDLAVTNLETAAAAVQLRWHDANGTASKSFQVSASSQQVFPDVVASLVGGDASGSIEIISDRMLAVRSRTFNQAVSGSFGQSLDGITSVDGLAVTQQASLVQLSENDSFRTNIGLVNPGTGEAVVDIGLVDRLGATVGTFSLTIPAGRLVQDLRPFRSRFGKGDVTGGAALVTLRSGSSAWAYASVIDNRTGDPTTITMAPVPACP